jgi:hypothetical protein
VGVDERESSCPAADIQVEVGGHGDGDGGPRPGGHSLLVVADPHLAGRVDRRGDPMADPAGLDHQRVADAERERDADDRLEGVALQPSGRRAVGGLVGHQHREVQHAGDQVGRHAGTVVGDGDAQVVAAVGGVDSDLGRGSGGLGGVQGVVDQLLDDHLAEPVGGLAGLGLEGAQLEELGRARGRERLALQGRAAHADHRPRDRSAQLQVTISPTLPQ